MATMQATTRRRGTTQVLSVRECGYHALARESRLQQLTASRLPTADPATHAARLPRTGSVSSRPLKATAEGRAGVAAAAASGLPSRGGARQGGVRVVAMHGAPRGMRCLGHLMGVRALLVAAAWVPLLAPAASLHAASGWTELPERVSLRFSGLALEECRRHVAANGTVAAAVTGVAEVMPLAHTDKLRVYHQHVTKAGGSHVGVSLPAWLAEHGRVKYDCTEVDRAYGSFNPKQWLARACGKRCVRAPKGAKDTTVTSDEQPFYKTAIFLRRGYRVVTELRDPVQRSLSTHTHFANKAPATYANACGANGAAFFRRCCSGGTPHETPGQCPQCRTCTRFSDYQAWFMTNCGGRVQCPVSADVSLANMAQISVVMITEYMPLSECLLFWKFNLLKRFQAGCLRSGLYHHDASAAGHLNNKEQRHTIGVNRAGGKKVAAAAEAGDAAAKAPPSAEDMAVLVAGNQVDYVLYNAAVERLVREVLGMLIALQELSDKRIQIDCGEAWAS